MKSTSYLFALVVALAGNPAAAHEVWIERNATGPARIYLGEPAEVMPDAGDPEFHHLQRPQFVGSSSRPVPLIRRSNHIEAEVGPGDVRVRDDAVFAPWKSGETMQGAIFYARSGLAETNAALDLELVPVTAGAKRLVVMFRGKPLPGAKVTVITPDRWQKAFVSDDKGEFEVPQQGVGRYLVSTSHTEEKAAKLGGQDVASVIHTSTLTFAD